ncbi:unnamed protein product [Euphydryas editha]|uniref:Uncharacterized protein n=1 Tax=Euphydryas editha TaxID=104508 RepID=A0AAU9UR22_EUPED|nr:unnamed protein product [Euphydryas editha]
MFYIFRPLHLAVLNNDVDLLKRQCIVLKTRQQSVDILSAGKLTALQMSLLNDCAKCTVVLLQYGADPLIPDEEARTPLHLAAEVSSENVQALLDHCRANARAILKDNESLWEDNFERKSEKDLAEFLIYKMCVECDNQGYTPLMLASRIGNYESVKLLIQAAPETINMSMPNCGNTALYLAVSAACLDCHERGNKASVAEKFMNTVGVLVENGADPAIDNNSGSNVNVLLTEFCISKLSMLIANKLTSAKYYDGEKIKNFDSYMLLKDADGKLNLKELKTPKEETKQQLNANNKINEEIKKVDSDKIEIKIIKSETNMEENDKEHGKIQYTYGKTYGKRKTLILQDIPVVANVGKRRPMILKKINTNSKITVSEPSIIKIDEQNLIPLKSLNTKIPIKLVKFLPKTDVKSSTTTTSTSTTSTSTTTNSTSNKRSISPSNSEHCSKKSKV